MSSAPVLPSPVLDDGDVVSGISPLERGFILALGFEVPLRFSP